MQVRLRNCSSAETSSGNFSSRELWVTEVFDWFCVYTFFGDRTNSSSVLGLSRMITEVGRYGVCYVGSVSRLCFKHIRSWRAFLLWESICICVAFFSIMWIRVQLFWYLWILRCSWIFCMLTIVNYRNGSATGKSVWRRLVRASGCAKETILLKMFCWKIGDCW